MFTVKYSDKIVNETKVRHTEVQQEGYFCSFDQGCLEAALQKNVESFACLFLEMSVFVVRHGAKNNIHKFYLETQSNKQYCKTDTMRTFENLKLSQDSDI